jgi:uncharacterized protein (DUF433 family)
MLAAVPVIRGTRIPLQALIDYFNDGRGLELFLKDHPQVTRAQAERAIVTGLQALVERRREVVEPGHGQPGEPSPKRTSTEGDRG